MWRKTLRTMAALGLILVMGVAAHAEPRLEKITIAQFGKERFLLYLPLYIAMEEGVFAKHGVEVSLRFAGNDDQIFASVLSGAAQFGMGDPVFAAISHDKGGPGKVVAMMIAKLPLGGVTNQEKVPSIASPKDLDGLRISSFPEPSTTYTLLKELKQQNRLKLSIVQAAFGGQMALLEAGKVDIAVDIEPSVSIAEDRGYRVVMNLADWSDRQAITGLTTTESYIASHPQTVQRVVSALQEAVILMHNDLAVAKRVARKLYPQLSDQVLARAVQRMLASNAYPTSVLVADDLWQRTLKTRLDSGDLSKPQATEVAVDNRFAEQAAKAVSLPHPARSSKPQ